MINIDNLPDTLDEYALVALGHIRDNFPRHTERTRTMLCLAEEAGELVGSYRRWNGMARRAGLFFDVADELGDVAIATYVSAAIFGAELGEPRLLAEPRRSVDQWIFRLYGAVGAAVDAYESNNGTLVRQFMNVIAFAHQTAAALGLDWDTTWRTKAAMNHDRDWREPPALARDMTVRRPPEYDKRRDGGRPDE